MGTVRFSMVMRGMVLCAIVLVACGCKPKVDFSAKPTSGVWPLTVEFKDKSRASGEAEITGWLWDFGDGNKSVEQDPVHVYKEAGIYSVSLTVATETGEDTFVANNFVTVEDAPDSDNDGIPDWLEEDLGTNPNKWDTSGDGLSDGALYYGGSDPLVAHGTLAPEAVILESNPELKLIEVGEDYLIFETPTTKAELLQPGMILVYSGSKPGETQKGLGDVWDAATGFLREVKEVIIDGVEIMVLTSAAAVQEVWPELGLEEKSYSVTIDTKDTELHEYLNDYEIYREGEGGTDLVVNTKDGRFLFVAIVSYTIDIRGGELQVFRAQIDGHTTIQVGAEIDVTGEYSANPEIPLVKVPIPVPYTPLILYLSTNVGLDLNLKGDVYASAWFKTQADITVGAEYRNGRFYDLSDVELPRGEKETDFEIYATTDAMVYLNPEIEISLYDRAGAYAGLVPYLGVHATYPCTSSTPPTLDVGLYGEVGIYADLFLWSYDPDPIAIPDDPIEYNLWTGTCDELNSEDNEQEEDTEGESAEGEQQNEGEEETEGEQTEGETPIEGEVEITPGEMVSVAAGTFEMGDPWDEGQRDELPVHSVTLSAYEIGKYEVTNQEYADVLNWGNSRGYLTTASTTTADAYEVQLLDVDATYCQITWSGSRFVVDTRDGYSMADHPVVEVSWYGAAVYCNWLSESQGLIPCYNTSTWTCNFSNNGYHLPTEAQWERSAAWDGSRHYRYGNSNDSISSSNANYNSKNPLSLSDKPYTSPVGYYPSASSPVGCYDMSGNVSEWCNDWQWREYTSSSVIDPTGPSSGSSRLLRSGGWTFSGFSCRSADRNYNTPDATGLQNGFRIAK